VHRAVAFDRNHSISVIRDWVEALDEHVTTSGFMFPGRRSRGMTTYVRSQSVIRLSSLRSSTYWMRRRCR